MFGLELRGPQLKKQATETIRKEALMFRKIHDAATMPKSTATHDKASGFHFIRAAPNCSTISS
jgi:formiminotetrahydrofolate cyclodeaminase